MKSNNNSISVVSLLGLVFVTLKLCGVIDWSWWFVLMPFYIPAIILFVISVVYFYNEDKKNKKKNIF